MNFRFAILLASCAFTFTAGRVCNNKQIIDTKPFTLGSGEVIQIQRFNCSSDTATPIRHSKKVVKRDTFDLNIRAASECTEPNCFCGVPLSQPIQSAHCTQLAAQLSNTQGTITIPENEGIGFILQSCEYTISGSETAQTQYCFDDLGAAVTELFAVCGPQQADCKATSGGLNIFVELTLANAFVLNPRI
ncbi:hypothetical protein JR316_0013449 [Psilocybe cubensis]|uniref:Uncharacterized protein n=1 Tax=Psilocybe cubensis TaxID=181762 RepID=A0ACB8GFG7_PSICU|nr:uncharacterized protein JR316_0013449 [Psilocybe cubensis]KAH9474286.1 hypothetical protein JR316_0013449 [Psilocybe cubensis]